MKQRRTWLTLYLPLQSQVFVDKSIIDAESGSTIEDKALNYLKKMTLFGKLATPEISTLYLPEKLKLYPNDNNILIEGGTGVLTTDANIEYHL